MQYEYDLFISYCHETSVKDWVQNHFTPLLETKLTQELPDAPRIFIDHQMPTGVYWKSTIERALTHSKLLLCVWSPPYFKSKWCQAEWQTILAREEETGQLPHERGLLYSVVFGDGDYFPTEANARQHSKFHDFALTSPAFKETTMYVDFERRVTEVAGEITLQLQQIPDWKDCWVVTDPDEVNLIPPKPLTQRPRI